MGTTELSSASAAAAAGLSRTLTQHRQFIAGILVGFFLFLLAYTTASAQFGGTSRIVALQSSPRPVHTDHGSILPTSIPLRDRSTSILQSGCVGARAAGGGLALGGRTKRWDCWLECCAGRGGCTPEGLRKAAAAKPRRIGAALGFWFPINNRNLAENEVGTFTAASRKGTRRLQMTVTALEDGMAPGEADGAVAEVGIAEEHQVGRGGRVSGPCRTGAAPGHRRRGRAESPWHRRTVPPRLYGFTR